jgi:hypothetical protein
MRPAKRRPGRGGTGEHALEVPDRLLRLGKCSVRKPPPFFFEKKPLKPHWLSGFGADVEDVDHQQVARLGALDADRAGEEMDLLRSTSRTSSASSSFLIWPPVQS